MSGATGYKLYIAEAERLRRSRRHDDVDVAENARARTARVTWWVVTTFAGCPDVVSAKSTFTSGTQTTCGATATLNSPADGATVTSPVTLSWSTVTGASGYRLWISVNGSSPILAARTVTVGGTSQQLQLPSGADEWYVETLFTNGCDSTFSAHRRFTVSAAANCDTHKAATLTSPIGGAQASNPITFNWTAADSAALQYRVWVSLNGEPFTDIGFTKDTKLQHDFGTATGSGAVVRRDALRELSGGPVGTGKLRHPLAGMRNRPVRRSSRRSTERRPARAGGIRLERRRERDRISRALDAQRRRHGSPEDDRHVDHASRPAGQRRMARGSGLRRMSDDAFGQVALHRPARRRTCVNDAPVLVAPADGATNLDSPVRFDWNPVSNAAGYLLVIRSKDGSPTALAETSTRTSVTKAVSEGLNEWWVVAFFNGCPPVESKHQFFTVTETACDDVRPILFAPAEGAAGLASPVHFEWSRVKDATEYKVWAAVDDEDESVIGTTTVNKLTVSVPGGTIHWHVQAFFESCPALDSATSTFTVRNAPPPCTTPDRPLANGAGAGGVGQRLQRPLERRAERDQLRTAGIGAHRFLRRHHAGRDRSLRRVHPHRRNGRAEMALPRPRHQQLQRRARQRIRASSSSRSSPRRRGSRPASKWAASSPVRQTIFIAGRTPAVPFTARTDKPWATVSPSSGTLGPDGVTLTILSDPIALKLGTNTATVILTFGAAGKGVIAEDTTPPVSVPVSVTTVTPVAPQGEEHAAPEFADHPRRRPRRRHRRLALRIRRPHRQHLGAGDEVPAQFHAHAHRRHAVGHSRRRSRSIPARRWRSTTS